MVIARGALCSAGNLLDIITYKSTRNLPTLPRHERLIALGHLAQIY